MKCNTKILEAVEIYFSHELVHSHWNLKRFTIMHRTEISCISQGGGVHLEINSPTPGGHYMGANAPQWKHNTTQLCAKYPGGGWATLKLMSDKLNNFLLLTKLLTSCTQTLNGIMNQFW